MSEPARLRVALGARSYDILIGPGLLATAGAHIAPLARGVPVIAITDETVAGLHLATLKRALDAAGIAYSTIIVGPGERAKEFEPFTRLIETILDRKPERNTLLIALGGGVIGDLVGFAAAVTLRGLDFAQIPTTLLAQVDSSVGGKTGINTRHGKNLVGSFHQPRLVLADTELLATLAARERREGYAEIVKYGLIGDAAFFAWLETNAPAVLAGDAATLRHAILTSCAAKAAVVAGDERESGDRQLLNFGHTFGHALEVETKYSAELRHGEAVAIGMVMAFDLSVKLGLCPSADAQRMRHHFAEIGLPTGIDFLGRRALKAETLLDHMRQDKKVRGGQITLVLTRGIGKAFVSRDVEPALLLDHLASAVAA